MGYQELIAALQQQGAAQVEAIRRETDAAREQIVAEAADRLQLLHATYSRKLAAAIAAETRGILAAAELSGRRIRLASERELAGRLFELAQRSLGTVAKGCGEELIASLAEELPPGDWEQVKVNPLDVELASRLFPGADILPEATIVAGMEVSRDGGTLRIVNTIEKRLELAWPEILPALLKEVYQEAVSNEPVAQD